jgi:hypothetical protein
VNIKRFVKQELAIRERMSSSGTEIEENKENDHSDGHKGSFDFFSQLKPKELIITTNKTCLFELSLCN